MGPVLVALVLLPFWISGTAGAYARPDAGAGDAPWFVDMNRFAKSAHAAFKCEDCHGTMIENGRKHPDPESPDYLVKPATRRFDYSRCRKCHQVAYDRYMEGEHAKALAEEKSAETAAEQKLAAEAGKDAETEGRDAEAPLRPVAADRKPAPAPTCGDCHVTHYDRSNRSRVEAGRSMVAVCGRCHAGHAASYMDNIHGREGVDLGNEKSAYCSDCHGAHRVVSLKKPEKALPVCQRCHPKARAEFTNVVIHASLTPAPEAGSAKDGSILWIHRIRLLAIGVLVVSLALFFGHSLLWLLRELHEKLRKR